MSDKKYDFSYLVKKITEKDFLQEPFRHIYIEDFFSEDHLNEILSSPEITSPKASNDNELIMGLVKNGYNPILFPGCITDTKRYIKWHEGGKISGGPNDTCEGFGMVLRLFRFQSAILQELNQFLASDEFNRAIAEKLGIDFRDCNYDGGIQKYLDGYEISPHPDIRRKAATFMVNINPSTKSEDMNHHTHYLKFKESYAYVQKFWAGNNQIERAWVPWSWTDSVKKQTKNNTIVIFSPSNDTMHGVKSDYNHLVTQRTQLYGNLWYMDSITTGYLDWKDLDLLSNKTKKNVIIGLRSKISKVLPKSIKSKLKGGLNQGNSQIEIGKRRNQ